MKLLHLLPVAALLAIGAAFAADPPPAQPAETTPPAKEAGEPDVKHILIEDSGSRIEELRVRGQTQRITVTTKQGGGASTYQIIVGDGARDSTAGRGATGQRVWSVLSF